MQEFWGGLRRFVRLTIKLVRYLVNIRALTEPEFSIWPIAEDSNT